MTRKLTETAVSRAGVPATGQTMLWDAQVTGFAVRILPGSSRTFWFQYRTAGGRSGKNRMVRIGAWPTISLNVARKRARDLAGQVARGEDPAATRAEAKRRDSSTLRALLVEEGPYQRDLERRGIVNRKVVLSGLNRGLHRLISKDVADLTRRDFVSAISALEAAGKPGAAGELRKYSRTLLEWCVSAWAGAGRQARCGWRALCSRTTLGTCGCACAVRPPLRACRQPRGWRWQRRNPGG